MKKAIALILATSMLFLVTGCGKQKINVKKNEESLTSLNSGSSARTKTCITNQREITAQIQNYAMSWGMALNGSFTIDSAGNIIIGSYGLRSGDKYLVPTDISQLFPTLPVCPCGGTYTVMVVCEGAEYNTNVYIECGSDDADVASAIVDHDCGMPLPGDPDTYVYPEPQTEAATLAPTAPVVTVEPVQPVADVTQPTLPPVTTTEPYSEYIPATQPVEQVDEGGSGYWDIDTGDYLPGGIREIARTNCIASQREIRSQLLNYAMSSASNLGATATTPVTFSIYATSDGHGAFQNTKPSAMSDADWTNIQNRFQFVPGCPSSGIYTVTITVSDPNFPGCIDVDMQCSTSGHEFG